jgi:Carboxypeptidase regulatory-like domain
MVGMIMKKFAVAMIVMIAVGMGVGAVRAWAQDDDEGPMSNMRFVVVRDASGKPVKNAAVVLHPVSKKGKQSMGGLELKTDDDGKTWIDGIPYGSLRVQVLAPGFQTFGEDYEITKPETHITVRLKRPTGQYSVYGGQDKDKDKNYGVQEKDKTTNSTTPSGSSSNTNKDKKTDPPSAQASPQTPPPAPPQAPEAKPPDQKPQ